MRRCLHKIFFLTALLVLVQVAPEATAAELSVGLAGIDNMSDQVQPAATVRAGWSKSAYSQLYYWGRSYGPVVERNLFLTLAGEAQLRG